MITADNLKEAMATSCTGWAAVIDGVLDVRTVAYNRQAAAALALQTKGIMAICTGGPDCECMVATCDRYLPGLVRIVPVAVRVVGG